MSFKSHSKLLLITFCVSVIGACTPEIIEEQIDKQKEEEELEERNGSMTAEVNGVNFESYVFDNGEDVLVSINEITEDLYLGAITGYDFRSGLTKPKVIILYFIGNGFDTLNTGETFDTISTDLVSKGAYAWYTQNNGDTGNEGFGDNNELEEVYIKITNIDKDEKLISGTFNYKGTSSVTGKIYTITNGKFTDVTYKLEQN